MFIDDSVRSAETKKLIPTLRHKKRYTLHHSALNLYTKLGMQLKAVYKVVEFRQSSWLKPYIDFNA